MKKIFYFSTLLFLSLRTQAQRAAPEPVAWHAKTEDLKTSRTLKTLGWVSLGTGVPLFLIGAGLELGSRDKQNGKGADHAARWMMPCGAALAASSVPLFIVSHHYKNKALSFSLGSQSIFLPQKDGVMAKAGPALTMTLNF